MSEDWAPQITGAAKPRYLAIVDALAGDIAAGRLQSGARLLPQRDMAERLGLAVGTISKAYAEAERRGLITSTVGRGTFVGRSQNAPGAQSADVADGPIDLTLNAPPPTGEDNFIAAAMSGLAASDINALLRYPPHAGLVEHRRVVAEWLSRHRNRVAPEQLVLCNGAQHAVAVALAVAARPGDIVLTEAVTYAGIVGLSEVAGYTLRGVGMDEEGLRPDRLDAAFRETGARVLYSAPTLQTPTAATMSEHRRREIASVLNRHGAMLIEDDVYSFLVPSATPLSALVPERSFHVSSFAKCAAPGLRVGALELPDWAHARALNALRAFGWAATPLAVALATRMIEDDSMSELVAQKQVAATQRSACARRVLGPDIAPPDRPAFHVWTPLDRPVAELIAAAAMRGVLLSPPTVVAGDAPPLGVRLCIGAPRNLDRLNTALEAVAAVIGGASRHSLV